MKKILISLSISILSFNAFAQNDDVLLKSSPSNVTKLPPLLVDPSLIKPNAPLPPMNKITPVTNFTAPNIHEKNPNVVSTGYIEKSQYEPSKEKGLPQQESTDSTVKSSSSVSLTMDQKPNNSGTLNLLNFKGSN